MEIPQKGLVNFLSDNKVEWLVNQKEDEACTPEFLINKTMKTKLIMIKYDAQENQDNNRVVMRPAEEMLNKIFERGNQQNRSDSDDNKKNIIIQLLLPPNAVETIEKVDLTYPLDGKKNYKNQRDLSLKPIDPLFPMILWSFKAIQPSPKTDVSQTNPRKRKKSNYDSTIDGCLRIVCEFSLKTVTIKKVVTIKKEPNIYDKYEELFNNGKYSDLIINVSGTKFKAHKAILSAQSKVFAAMLEDHTKENKENKIDIKDVNVGVMREILRFVYAGKVNDIEKMAFDLVIPADKYELHDLLTLCQNSIIKTLCMNNIKEILNLVNLIELKVLKESTMQFIAINRHLLSTKDFSNFFKTLHPPLLADIISALLI